MHSSTSRCQLIELVWVLTIYEVKISRTTLLRLVTLPEPVCDQVATRPRAATGAAAGRAAG